MPSVRIADRSDRVFGSIDKGFIEGSRVSAEYGR
jgi:hypothetical protein